MDKCEAGVSNGELGHICNRPAKGRLDDGTPVCGIHLRVETERKMRDQEFKEHAELSKIQEKKVKAFVERHGIQLKRCLGNDVYIDFDELRRVVEGK